MHCPYCAKPLAAVSADFVSERKYYVCLQCCHSLKFTEENKSFNHNNGNSLTVVEFIRCLRILETRGDEGLAARRLVKKLLLLCLLNREKGRFHIGLTEPLSKAVSKIREASGTSECDDMRILLTGLSLLYLGGVLRDQSIDTSDGLVSETPLEQEMLAHT